MSNDRARLGTRLSHVIYVRPTASNEIPGYWVFGIWTVSEGGGRGSIHFLEVHIWEPIKLILALQIIFAMERMDTSAIATISDGP